MRRDVVSLHAALVLSGAAGLIYQSSWTRLLQRVFGVGDLAVATVLATYFLGLGLGTGIAARYVARVTRPGRAYAILEVAIGLYALLSLAIVPGLGAAYGALGADASFTTLTLVRFCLACLALLPPTILMGATLPVVAEATKDAAWSRSVTAFYTSNTLGAVVGAGLAGFVLVPQLGTRATVVVGALLSFAAAVLVLVLLRDARKPTAAAPIEASPDASIEAPPDAPPTSSSASSSSSAPPSPTAGTTPVGLAATLAFVAGLAALGSEVVWTRVLRIIVHGTTPAFAAMLVNYLLGIAAGALLARALSRRVHPAVVLGVSQTLLVAFTAVAMALVPFVPRIIPILSGEPDTVPHDTWVIGLVSGVLLFPLALMLGTSLPSTWAMIERRSDAGSGSAALLAANTVGGLIGSLATGFFLVPALGTEATLLALASLNVVVAAIALRHAAPRDESPRALTLRIGSLVGPLVVLTLVLVARPSIQLRFLLGSAGDPVNAMIQGPTEAWQQRTVFLREGRNTTVTVLRNRNSLTLYNDGRPESGFSSGRPGFGPELVVLGGLPGVLAERRDDAMIIGLGAGHSTAVALATGFAHVRVIELEEGVVEASRLLYEARDRPFPLDDPRAQLIVDDARNQLNLMPPDSLDAVISQPSHPWLAGSSALYTREFFLEVDRALRDGGVFGLWVNLFRMDMPRLRAVLRTLLSVFPEVRGFVVEGSSLVLMASSTPRPLGEAQGAMLRDADVDVPYFGGHHLDTVRQLLAHQELDTSAAQRLAGEGELVVDDRPLLELELAALANTARLGLADFDWALREVPWSTGDSSVEGMMARVDLCQTRARALDRLSLSNPASALIRGRIAEARGDVTRALEAYDADGSIDARVRAARLRYAQGLDDALLASVVSWPSDTEIDDVVLLSALHARRVDPSIAAAATRSATPLGNFVREASRDDCASADRSLAEAYAEVARYMARCAEARGQQRELLDYEQLAWRSRTVQAANDTRLGEGALSGGNGGLAWMLFERVLRNYPTTTRAAIGLAQLHARDGRPDEARRVLSAALEATARLDEAQVRILGAAASLSIELVSSNEGPGESSASTAPVVMDP